MIIFFVNQAHFDIDQFELHRADGRKLLKWNAVPTVFTGSSERKLLSLKRPVAQPPVNHLIRTMDHEYSKRHCLYEENVSPKTVNHAVASSISLPELQKRSVLVVEPVLPLSDNIHSLDHEYSERPCIDKDNLLPDCIVLDTLSEEMSLSQATIYHSLSQFIAAQSGNDKALICSLRKRIRRLTRRLTLAREQSATMKKNLSRFLNADQIGSLSRKAKSKGMKWTNTTVKKALQIRCATGVKGYSHLIREGFPMPSYRTLCERVEKAQFEPGIQNNVLEWLKVKVDTFGNSESKDCAIASVV